MPSRNARVGRPAPDLERLPADALLDRRDLEALTGFRDQTFRRWSCAGRGPKVTRAEGRPRYRVEDVQAWLADGGAA